MWASRTIGARTSRRTAATRKGTGHTAIGWTAAALLCTTPLHAGGSHAIMGYQDLVDRLGDQVPTGAGVRVGQTEGPQSGNYAPNLGSSQFTGKTFFLMSGPSDESAHATNVAGQMYGNTSSMSPGVSEVFCYEASNWLYEGFLRTGLATTPRVPPPDMRVYNNSWIGSLTQPGFNNQALRRADWTANAYGVLIVSGMANNQNNVPLMSHQFNGVSVGKMEGGHSNAPTLAEIDGPGRMKPEIVAPGNTTSTATPRVSSAAILLFETAVTHPALAGNPRALRPDVIKAALLAGATKSDAHGAPWTNNPIPSGPQRGSTAQPIDAVVGAGTVNVNRSHLILTGGQQAAGASPSTAPAISAAGWDCTPLPTGGEAYWSFTITSEAEELSVITTVNRFVPTSFIAYTAATIELELLRIGEDGFANVMVGEEGAAWYGSGNVRSDSAADNIQHLHIRNLEPGSYMITTRRTDALPTTFDVATAWLIEPDVVEVPVLIGDLNGDGVVNLSDLILLLAVWGDCPIEGPCPADLNGDGAVDLSDLIMLLTQW